MTLLGLLRKRLCELPAEFVVAKERENILKSLRFSGISYNKFLLPNRRQDSNLAEQYAFQSANR